MPRPTDRPAALRVSTRNATFQQWQALLENRTKRHRAGRLLVQGVRPIDEAVAAGWTVLDWLVADRDGPSPWVGRRLADAPRAQVHHVAPELMAELGEKDDAVPELLAVVAMPADDLSRIAVGPDFLGVLLDRPANPGNVGTVLRSLDAFGGHGLITSGHATDAYDPRTVRASTGSVFRVPVVRSDSPGDVLDWVAAVRAAGTPLQLVGTDETGDRDVDATDLTGPVLVLTGNETSGLSRAWRDACDQLVRIPMSGHASSLNAASATTVVLYEAARQRRG